MRVIDAKDNGGIDICVIDSLSSNLIFVETELLEISPVKSPISIEVYVIELQSLSPVKGEPTQRVKVGMVHLDGNNSDDRAGGYLTYQWTQPIEQSNVTPFVLSGSTIVNPTFTLPLFSLFTTLQFKIEITNKIILIITLSDIPRCDGTITRNNMTTLNSNSYFIYCCNLLLHLQHWGSRRKTR